MSRRIRDSAQGVAAGLGTCRVLVVCGSGGVGKTTTAAALALRAALDGRRVLVCTIDPSRRLATSLGLERLSPVPRRLDIGRMNPEKGGTLSAVILDTKRTFDGLVERHAPTEEARRRILENGFYRQVSAALAGSHEYMAMEKLLELSEDERFDLVVLDTPPTRHALDFLEAPDRMTAFLDTSMLRFFLKPYFVAGRLTIKVATRAGAMALRLADHALGLKFLQDLSEFFLAFDGMYDGFKERAARVYSLLRQPSSGFVLVTSPSGQAISEAAFFQERLATKAMPFVGLIVNRVHPDPAAGPAPAATRRSRNEGRTPTPEIDADLAKALLGIYRDQQALARIEGQAVARLEVDSGSRPILVPELEADVHDLRGLAAVAELILPSGARPSTRRPARPSPA